MSATSNIKAINGEIKKYPERKHVSNDASIENELAKIVIELCRKIHKELGPGLLESVYEEVLCYELNKSGLKFSRQQQITLVYDSLKIDMGFYADIIVEDKLIVALEAVESLAQDHPKMLLTCLRLANKKLGLLVNFNVVLIEDGTKRIVNNLFVN